MARLKIKTKQKPHCAHNSSFQLPSSQSMVARGQDGGELGKGVGGQRSLKTQEVRPEQLWKEAHPAWGGDGGEGSAAHSGGGMVGGGRRRQVGLFPMRFPKLLHPVLHY